MSTNVRQVVVIGAGPSGIVLAIQLLKYGIRTEVIDKHGEAGGAFLRMYPKLVLTTPKQLLEISGFPFPGERDYLTATEYGRYLADVAEQCSISPTKENVIEIKRDGQHLRAIFESGQSILAQVIVVATGMSDHPVIPDYVSRQSIVSPNIVHSDDWRGPESIRGPHVIIVGAKLRAIELAEECASYGYQVLISARKPKLTFLPKSFFGREYRPLLASVIASVPLWLVRSYCRRGVPLLPFDQGCKRFLKNGSVKIISKICDIKGREVITSDGNSYAFDTLVLATGFRYDMSFLPKTIQLNTLGIPRVQDGVHEGVSGIYFLGLPCCFKLDSHFIQGISRDAAVLAYRIATRLGSEPIQKLKTDSKQYKNNMNNSPTTNKESRSIRFRSSVLSNLYIVCASVLANVAIMIVTIMIFGAEKDGWNEAVRNTIRMPSLLFVLLLTLDNLSRRFENRFWSFLRIHRRGLGLGFAAAVAVHLTTVFLFLEHDGKLPRFPALLMDTTAVTFLTLMAITSNDKAIKLLTIDRWKLLHRAGIWACWFTLLIPFASRIRLDVNTLVYWIFSLMLIVAMYIWLRPAPGR